MQEARILDEWRDAVVTPIYKKGRKTEPGNYHPVSLTRENTGKNHQKRMVQHVETNNLICDTQHGFQPCRSVQTNLVDFLNQATKWTDTGESFDVLYLDFQKSFDKVCHQRLMIKLDGVGIRGKLGEWIKGCSLVERNAS